MLELIAAGTLANSLAAVREPGTVCMTGMVGDLWSISDFEPMAVIPTGVSLTTYSGEVGDFMAMPFQSLVDQVEAGTLPVRIGKVFNRLRKIGRVCAGNGISRP